MNLTDSQCQNTLDKYQITLHCYIFDPRPPANVEVKNFNTKCV